MNQMSEVVTQAVEKLGHTGELIECSQEDWIQYRDALQEAAVKWIEQGQHVRSVMALNEIKRLDAKHGTAI